MLALLADGIRVFYFFCKRYFVHKRVNEIEQQAELDLSPLLNWCVSELNLVRFDCYIVFSHF